MKNNQPVTQNEVSLPKGRALVSKTDVKGTITYANRAFIETCGFSESELLGVNHNLVRHPDMPPEAFQNLWDTLKLNKPWSGIVKNRTKSGDFYWVKAEVTPLHEKGVLTGYMSVRQEPTKEEVSAAEALYKEIRAGNVDINKKPLADKLNIYSQMKLGSKFAAMVIAFLLPLLVIISMYVGSVSSEISFIQDQIKLSNDVASEQTLSLQARAHQLSTDSNQAFIVAGVLTFLALLLTWKLVDGVVKPLSQIVDVFYSMGEGDFSTRLVNSGQDEIANSIDALHAMQIQLAFEVDTNNTKANESMRIQQALDAVNTNVMVADADNDIIYMNQSVQELFTAIESDVRAELPQFKASALLRSNLNMIHRIDQIDYLKNHIDEEFVLGGRTLRIDANPVCNKYNERLGTVIVWQDLTEQIAEEAAENERLAEERKISAENQRIRIALDNVSSNVMLANADREIIYINKAVEKLFVSRETEIRQDLPKFNAKGLIGSNIDQFHKNPHHQVKLLENLSSTFNAEFEIGGLTMQFAANPVIDDNGERLGTAVEWADRTEEIAVEREIDSLIDAASAGDLSHRLPLENKSGFFLQLSTGFNTLLDELSSVFDEIADVMGYMAKGDLTHSIQQDYQGAFLDVKNNVNLSISNVENTISQLRGIADQVNNVSEEISSGNNNLSARTEQQASSLQETAASMEELTSTVKNNAENATQATQVSDVARTSAEKGGAVVGDAIEAMKQINASSNEIAEIIGVIDEIAFQTNLLALNASVEAARAGDQGRGFAVVATEVRNLAGRSATAAKEIKELIQDSVAKVKSGSILVEQTGEALGDIEQRVDQVAEIISEISTSSNEQSAGISQVNLAITHIDETTQQNAALAEEASAASEVMKGNANEMKSMMDFFVVDGSAAISQSMARDSAKPVVVKREMPVAPAQKAQAPTQVISNDEDDWEEF